MPKRFIFMVSLALALVGFWVVISALQPARAQSSATIVVNDPGDSDTGCPDACTLRAALAEAQKGTVITFDPALTGPITVSSPLQIANLTVAINGPGADVLTIDGAGSTQIFNIQASTVSLSGVTVSNGSISGVGGGMTIMGASTVIIDQTTFENNTSTGNGGAIYSEGTLTITNSAFLNNSAGTAFGGAIENKGKALTIISSTLYGNSANDGGAISNDGQGMSVLFSTVSGNVAHRTGGAFWASGAAVTIRGSIIAGNVAEGSGGAVDILGKVTSQGYNIIGVVGTLTGLVDSDQQDVTIELGEPTVEAPAKTPTMKPAAGSIAIGKGGPKCVATDQRGVKRKNPCDVGAYESSGTAVRATATPKTKVTATPKAKVTATATPKPKATATPKVKPSSTPKPKATATPRRSPTPRSSPTPIPSPTTGPSGNQIAVNDVGDDETDCSQTCTLRGAISVAGPGDEIFFDASVSGEITINTTLEIDKDLFITGPGANVLTISGGNKVRIFTIQGAQVKITGLSLNNGFSAETGEDAAAVNPGDGGAINMTNATVTIQDATFQGNVSEKFGGAISVQAGGNLTVERSSFISNQAGKGSAANGFGGAIRHLGASMTVVNCTFYQNEAQDGGAISQDGSNPSISFSTFSQNTATRTGAAFWSNGTPIKLTGSIVAGNTDSAGTSELYGKVVSGGFNVFGKLSTGQGQISTDQVDADPLLDVLAIPDGGTMPMLGLQDGSPAIGGGGSECPATDQRGATRKNPCDSGSFETGG